MKLIVINALRWKIIQRNMAGVFNRYFFKEKKNNLKRIPLNKEDLDRYEAGE